LIGSGFHVTFYKNADYRKYVWLLRCVGPLAKSIRRRGRTGFDFIMKATEASAFTREKQVVTQSAQVWQRLRADILVGDLLPGSRLRMEELRDRYGVGFSPLREALMRLEAEGLVLLRQNKGFQVLPASPEHLRDVCAVRREVECLALRWSIERGDLTWESHVVAAFHRLSRETKFEGSSHRLSRPWVEAHRNFHAALTSASGSVMIETFRETAFDQSERYVALSISNTSRLREDVDEHEAIMKAALARDADRACRLSAAHIERTMAKAEAAILEPAGGRRKRR
jgi:DNA-binding GntR family transcriptional regulator